MDAEKRSWLRAGLAVLLGLAGLTVGVFYRVIFAGIPYQDPTPELVARYEFHSWLSQIICCAGAMVEIIGLALAGVLLARRIRRRRGGGTG